LESSHGAVPPPAVAARTFRSAWRVGDDASSAGLAWAATFLDIRHGESEAPGIEDVTRASVVAAYVDEVEAAAQSISFVASIFSKLGLEVTQDMPRPDEAAWMFWALRVVVRAFSSPPKAARMEARNHSQSLNKVSVQLTK
jgi:hypothetical protein